MRRLPPLNALRAFDAAARHLSISAAAQELHVTHSAVSHQVRQLEQWLGKSLFVRHAAGVRLTAEGQSLKQAVDHTFSMLVTRCAEIAEQAPISEIVLGAPGSFLSNWLIPRLDRFEANYPGVRVRLQTSASMDELRRQVVDCLIVSDRNWPADVEVVNLFDETAGPVCAPSWPHRIAMATDLPSQPLLHTSSRAHAWMEWASRNGLEPAMFDEGRRFDHLSLMLEAAAAGLGVAIAPALLVERELSQGKLIAPLGFQPNGAAFALCAMRDRSDKAFRNLREWLLKESAA
ncbi:LysR substrate-binding domain-containing protein [Burkholderia sp. Ac-20365]|jgi:DNA-binding transcriptional LysR family regulator|uniref:LysR substrate-binding domain-containing protein n=1 Tax=Burkholderia sp. Ac-20365 TaxID=2703897 RepID=UPI00197C4E60|nr:LysR substrate-binding domain-containing protein [Burkholderia sp. Ac-20365]MBN3766157.1 LysR family transcriptional regulator [Burkholderia sp. Ac-20365]